MDPTIPAPPAPVTVRKLPAGLIALLPIVVMVAAIPFLAKSVQQRQLTDSQAKAPPNTYCVATFGCPTPTPIPTPRPKQ